MGLQPWSSIAPVPEMRPGYVIFETAALPGVPHVYHAMLVRSDELRMAHGGMQAQVADMTLQGIRFGKEWSPKWRLEPTCHIGNLNELDAAEHSRVLGMLATLQPDTVARGVPIGVYDLSGHAVFVPDPTNPQRSTFRCSCASLIEWCFEQLGYDLVNEADLPIFDAASVRAAFCPTMALPEVKKKLAAWGLDPEGSWPLLLPAHQMRAFRLTLAELPRSASAADHPCP